MSTVTIAIFYTNFMRSSWDFCQNVPPYLINRYRKTAFNTVFITISFHSISFFYIARHHGNSSTFGAKFSASSTKFAQRSNCRSRLLPLFIDLSVSFGCVDEYLLKTCFAFPIWSRLMATSGYWLKPLLCQVWSNSLGSTCLFLRKEGPPLCVPTAAAW